MKYLPLLLVLLIPALTLAQPPKRWFPNPQTGRADYYKDLVDSGLTIPQPYQKNPTLISLRDLLIAAGIMLPGPLPGDGVYQDWDDGDFQDWDWIVQSAIRYGVNQEWNDVVFQEDDIRVWQERSYEITVSVTTGTGGVFMDRNQ